MERLFPFFNSSEKNLEPPERTILLILSADR
jgi:hypothetical protein